MISSIVVEHVTFIPETLEEGVLYVSRQYKTASHLCCCGCRAKVVTPLGPTGWRFSERRGSASLFPSIGNWSFPCRSHYFIQEGSVAWALRWSEQHIAASRAAKKVPNASASHIERGLQWLRELFAPKS